MFAFTAEPVHGFTAMLISVPSPGSAAVPLVPVVPVSPSSPDPASEHAAAIRPSAVTSSKIRHHLDSRVLIRPPFAIPSYGLRHRSSLRELLPPQPPRPRPGHPPPDSAVRQHRLHRQP